MIASVTLGGAEAWTGFFASAAVVAVTVLRVRTFVLKKVVNPLAIVSGGDGRDPLPETVRKQGEAIAAMTTSIAELTVSAKKVEHAVTLNGGQPMRDAVGRIEHKLDDHIAAYTAREAVVSERLRDLEDKLR